MSKYGNIRVIRTNGWLRNHFTNNELSGWMDGVRYGDIHSAIDEQARQRRAAQVKKQAERRRRKLLSGAVKQPKATRVSGGINLLNKNEGVR